MSDIPHVLILGGGYLGLTVAQHLERYTTRFDVTIVEPNGFMTYQPLLPEVAGGHVDPRDVTVPLAAILKKTRIVTGSVVSLDSATKTAVLTTDAGEQSTETYDHVVLALGGVSRTFPTPGLSENAVGFKSLDDAVYVRNRVLESIEIAARAEDAEARRKALTFVFVGAGYTGVEALAELSDVSKLAVELHPTLDEGDLRWVLVEALDRVAPEVGPELSAWSLDELRARGIDVRLKTTVASLENGNVVLSPADGGEGSETIAARTIVWTTGITPHPVLDHTDLPRGEKGHLIVNAALQVSRQDGEIVEGAWAAGDIAQVPDLTANTQPAFLPPNAQNAVRQGPVIAANIVAAIRGKQPFEYRHRSLGTIASYGIARGAANILQRFELRNLPAWLAHRGYHGLAIPGMANKRRVIAGWLLNPLNWQDLNSRPGLRKPAL